MFAEKIKETFMKMINLMKVKKPTQTYQNSTSEEIALESELKESSYELVND